MTSKGGYNESEEVKGKVRIQKHDFEKALKEDIKIFKKHIELGAKKLAGAKTKERVRYCYHCKIWNKADKFIKEVTNIK